MGSPEPQDRTFTVPNSTERSSDNCAAEGVGKVKRKYKIPYEKWPALDKIRNDIRETNATIAELSERQAEKESEAEKTTEALARMTNKNSNVYNKRILQLAKKTNEVAVIKKDLKVLRNTRMLLRSTETRYLVDNHDPDAIVLPSGTSPPESNSAQAE
jgi:hypothetical protein